MQAYPLTIIIMNIKRLVIKKSGVTRTRLLLNLNKSDDIQLKNLDFSIKIL